MQVKELLKTKTFWSGVGLVVYGVLNQDWEAVLTGLSVVFLRDAINKVGKDSDNYGLP
jgi:hypothetical protein